MDFSYNRGGFLSQVPPVTKNIILINILVWIMTALNENFMISNFALFYPSSPYFRPWQIVTHMFMHGGFWHLFFNMYTLFIFGIVLERVWGTKKFLIFYFVTGLGAALLHTGVQAIQAQYYLSHAMISGYHTLQMIPTVGASGAIYGILLGYAMLFPESRLTLLFPPVTLTAKWFVLIFAGIELLTGITGVGGNIAHFAHLGGMLFGLLLILYWKKHHRMY